MSKKFLLDVFERSAWTYIQSVVALLLVAGPLDLDVLGACLIAGLPAALAVIKCSGARLIGDKDSAATLR